MRGYKHTHEPKDTRMQWYKCKVQAIAQVQGTYIYIYIHDLYICMHDLHIWWYYVVYIYILVHDTPNITQYCLST